MASIRPVRLSGLVESFQQSSAQADQQRNRAEATRLLETGDPEDFKRAVLLDPGFAQDVNEGFGIINAQQEKELKNDLITTSAILSSGGEDAQRVAANNLIQRSERLSAQGRDTRNTDEIINLIQRDPLSAQRAIDTLAGQSTLGKGDVTIVSGSTELVTVPVTDAQGAPVLDAQGQPERQMANTFTTFNKRTNETRQVTTPLGSGAEVFEETPEEELASKARLEEIKTDEQIRREREKAAIEAGAAREIKSEEAAGTSKAKRDEEAIDRGLEAAEALANIDRAIQLLEFVDTGGFARASLAVKRTFGIEGADEGELAQNLGKAVLSQLRETFGAAFTEKEGAKLEGIEAGIGKSRASNLRTLKQLKKTLNRNISRGRRAAERTEDDFAIEDFDEFAAFTFDPAAELEQERTVQTLPDGSVQSQTIGRFQVEVSQ